MSHLSKLLLIIACLGTCQALRAAEIRHKFLAVDESRAQLVFVDQGDPSKDWTIKLPGKHRDLQLVGKHLVLLTFANGYHEYRLTDQQLSKEVQGFPGATSARRLPDGRTILTCNTQGVTVHELSPDDKPLRKATFQLPSTRVVRLTPQGTFLIGSGPQLIEGDWNGKVLRTLTLPNGTWAYQALQLPNGHVLACGGYDPSLFELDAKGAIVRTIGGRQTAEARTLGFSFFGAFQILAKGQIVVCNWTGHDPNDSLKGAQLVQFDPAGQLVWKWHDPKRAGSINGVIVLDDLDTAVLNDDLSSVLGPVR